MITPRDEMQYQAVAKFLDNITMGYTKNLGDVIKVYPECRKGIIVIPSRVGKTRVGCLVAQRYFSLYRICIVVPNDTIKHQWEKELKELGLLHATMDLWIYTRGEVLNFKSPIPCKLLIIDEAHRFISPVSEGILKGKFIAYNDLLLLTATPCDDLYIYAPIVFSITDKEARDQGYIAPSKEYNVPVYLNDDEKEVYRTYAKHIGECLKTYHKTADKLNSYLQGYIDGIPFNRIFPRDYNILQSCYTGVHLPTKKNIRADNFRLLVAQSWGWKPNLNLDIPSNKWIDDTFNPNNLLEVSRIFNDIVRKRNNLINFNQAKLDTTIDIIMNYSSGKVIVFSQSTEFADELNSRLNRLEPGSSVVFHSKIESRSVIDPETGQPFIYKSGKRKGEVVKKGAKYFKDDAISGMINGRYRILCTVASLNEGLNIPDLEVAVITSGDCDPTKQSQRSARVKTIDENNIHKLAYIFNVYIDNFYDDATMQTVNSRDLAKLQERQTNKDVIWINSLDEVK
jgi:superfamily II DNA or RNA helicase